ncbi:MAG: hypothetical protein IPI35_20495 [Deltaproteobacteria bacterium]|nr:hypothetical protein [Deltaproteobacteria bacterium]
MATSPRCRSTASKAWTTRPSPRWWRRPRSRRGRGEGDDEGGDEEEAAEAPEEAEPEEALGEDATDADEPSADDPRAEARRRAVAWGRRAALAGKLVKKGKPTDPAHLAQLDAAARQLIFDVKLPGELYLVRWGGTRKGAGTFYTPRALTMPTVRRTWSPCSTQGRRRRACRSPARGALGAQGV